MPALPHNPAPAVVPMRDRLPALRGAATWDEVDPAALAAWDAPYGPHEQWDLRIEDREAPGPHGPVPVRVYTPASPAAADRPALVWCHGGGFMHGDLDMPEADAVARGVAGRADAVVVSVDYRLCDEPEALGGRRARRLPGPEATVADAAVHAPIPLEDVLAAVDWTLEAAAELGIGPQRLALGGASAGGNLAAAASLRLAEQGRAPAASMLLYPVAHPLRPEPTTEEAAAVADLPAMLRFTLETMRLFTENYLGEPLSQATIHDFPGLAGRAQLAALPRTYIEADEHDDLRTSARRYAEQLAEAGVEVEYAVRAGVAHGHLNRVGLREAAQTMDRLAEILTEL
ncbi:MAG: alpha/beta hydrolase fold domain-containing protein [Dermabacteraceae bacterium]